MKTTVFIGVLVLGLSAAVMAQQQGAPMQDMMRQHHGGMMPMMEQCSAMMKAHDGGRADTALEILKKRYARGEINKDDFERMKKDVE